VSPADRGANASIADAFAFSAAAYRRLASAARRGDASAYAAATRSVRRGEQRARRALDGLKALGYSVR
jgi:hypothetical protein